MGEAFIQNDLREPYRWHRLIARGGMGEVHVVEHTGFGDLRVMKILRAKISDDPELREDMATRLKAEARIILKLRHPHLVEVFDVGVTPSGRPFMVMELLEGETLKMMIEKREKVDLTLAVDLMCQTLEGLAHVHAQRMVHRDIKPDNLFAVDQKGAPFIKILDFGISKVLGTETRAQVGLPAQTQAGTLLGTPLYCAPEQILAKDIDERADLYAVGGVLFHLLTGKGAFARATVTDIYMAHIEDQPPVPSSIVEVPSAIDAVVLKALAKSPDDRFRTAAEMRAALLEAARPKPRQPMRTVRMTPGGQAATAPLPRGESADAKPSTAADADTAVGRVPSDDAATIVGRAPILDLEEPARSPAPRADPRLAMRQTEPLPAAYRPTEPVPLASPPAVTTPTPSAASAPVAEPEVRPETLSREPAQWAARAKWIALVLGVIAATLLLLRFVILPLVEGRASLPRVEGSGYIAEGWFMNQGPNSRGDQPATHRAPPVMLDPEATPIEPPTFDLAALQREAEQDEARRSKLRQSRVQASQLRQTADVVFRRALEKGELIANYRVVRALSSGGMARLYVVEHLPTATERALKILNDEYCEHPLMVERFKAEAKVMSEWAGHPNLVQVFDTGEDPRVGHYIVMELLSGRNLRDFIDRHRAKGLPVPIDTTMRVVIAMAEVLHSSHEMGVIHRDVKPENIFVELDAGGQMVGVKLLDFGVAKSSHSPHTTNDNVTAGTPQYMAPEQIERKRVTGAADQFSLNHVLYELVYRHAFAISGATPSLYLLWQRKLEIQRPPMDLVWDELWAVMQRAFQRNAEDRFPSARAYADALREALASGMQPERAARRRMTSQSSKQAFVIEGMATQTLPRGEIDIAPPSENRAPKRRYLVTDNVPLPTLMIVGPPELADQRFELGEEGVIGRDPAWADLVIAHPTVSTRHLRYSFVTGEPSDPIYNVEDLGSANGTEIAHMPVRARACSIRIGELVKVGDVVCSIAPPGVVRSPPAQPRSPELPATVLDSPVGAIANAIPNPRMTPPAVSASTNHEPPRARGPRLRDAVALVAFSLSAATGGTVLASKMGWLKAATPVARPASAVIEAPSITVPIEPHVTPSVASAPSAIVVAGAPSNAPVVASAQTPPAAAMRGPLPTSQPPVVAPPPAVYKQPQPTPPAPAPSPNWKDPHFWD